MTTTLDEIKRLREIAEKATPGLWVTGDNFRLLDALERACSTLDNIANDKWAMTTDFKMFDCSIGEAAKEALADIDRIFEEKSRLKAWIDSMGGVFLMPQDFIQPPLWSRAKWLDSPEEGK